MLRTLWFLWVFLLFLCVPGTTFASAQSPKTVTLTADPEKPGGFLLELTNEAFKAVGYEVDIKFEPWARALDAAMDGEVDGVLGCLYSEMRAQKLAYSNELATSETGFFALERSNITYTTLKDLSKYTIGTKINAHYPPNFSSATHLKTEPVSDYLVNIRKLLAGRIDLFVEKRLIVQSYLAELPQSEADRIVALDPPLAVNKYFNGFSKAVPSAQEKLRDFDKGLQMIKENGLYAAIMAKGLHE